MGFSFQCHVQVGYKGGDFLQLVAYSFGRECGGPGKGCLERWVPIVLRVEVV